MEGKNGYRVSGTLVDSQRIHTNLAISRQGKDKKITSNNAPIKNRSSLVRMVPSIIFSHETLEANSTTSAARRGLLDWCLFHVEPFYYSAIENHRQTLNQYNAALRGQSGEIKHWRLQLAESGELIYRYRAQITTRLGELFDSLLKEFPELPPTRLYYRRGWPNNTSLLDSMAARYQEQLKSGYCTVGSHRADYRVVGKRGEIQNWASRGQIKAYYYLLFLAVIRVVVDAGIETPLVLVDDLGAELSDTIGDRLLQSTLDLPCQLFITATGRQGILVNQRNQTMFHVKHGLVTVDDYSGSE